MPQTKIVTGIVVVIAVAVIAYFGFYRSTPSNSGEVKGETTSQGTTGQTTDNTALGEMGEQAN